MIFWNVLVSHRFCHFRAIQPFDFVCPEPMHLIYSWRTQHIKAGGFNIRWANFERICMSRETETGEKKQKKKNKKKQKKKNNIMQFYKVFLH